MGATEPPDRRCAMDHADAPNLPPILDGPRRRRMAVFLVVVAAVIVGYWVAWFCDRSLVASAHSRTYVAFEEAFPAADGWLVVCLLAGATTLVRRLRSALGWLLAGAGAGIYLCAMDVTYDLEHGIWWRDANGLLELAINVATVTISVAVGRWAWRRRQTLADLAPAADRPGTA